MDPICGPLCAHAASGTPGSDIQPIPCSYCSKARCTGEVTTQLANCTHDTLRVFPPHEHAATRPMKSVPQRRAAPLPKNYSLLIVITIPPSPAHIGGAGAGNFIRCSIFGVPGPKVMARASAVHNLPKVYGVPASEDRVISLGLSPYHPRRVRRSIALPKMHMGTFPLKFRASQYSNHAITLRRCPRTACPVEIHDTAGPVPLDFGRVDTETDSGWIQMLTQHVEWIPSSRLTLAESRPFFEMFYVLAVFKVDTESNPTDGTVDSAVSMQGFENIFI
ncbi:hypothetical protein B0H11DRAFT_1928120 [Mycena galericulata]|nr:hypothetical protein B0H11DRAFT_1928120 [Mycena galericulata]